MQLGKNKFDYYGNLHEKKKRRNRKILIFLGFSFILGIIIFSILYNNGSITGNIIFSGNPNNSIIISSELNPPNLSLKGNYSEIKIFFDSTTKVYLGEKSFLLEGPKENQIILENFFGKINLDEDGILLDGKVFRVDINGIPIQEKNYQKIKIYINSNSSYASIEFKEDLFLKEINYVSSGILFIGKENQDKIVLNEDILIISNYFGKLKIDDDILFLDGFAGNIKIGGDNKKISISK